jgi:hypothetical protein
VHLLGDLQVNVYAKLYVANETLTRFEEVWRLSFVYTNLIVAKNFTSVASDPRDRKAL